MGPSPGGLLAPARLVWWPDGDCEESTLLLFHESPTGVWLLATGTLYCIHTDHMIIKEHHISGLDLSIIFLCGPTLSVTIHDIHCYQCLSLLISQNNVMMGLTGLGFDYPGTLSSQTMN
ncbi:uncharacterized protein L3040_007755 [Drepanopeziza brunnea f. sp. 'multigermtubi']|uniref:uncharacterized protein n=1 Tax=Drepanopeziza brunnea f. sp. 'multigermtubi' TaxID=698441 RepID=UPI002397482E|nr:hypothetical protein L3040_007755 [Drepanopeziza brunnea f. sp. 'multigermtubi']